MQNPEEHVMDLLDDLVHGLLEQVEAQRVAEHCERCSSCRDGLQQARQRYQALAAVPPVEASERLIQNTLARVADGELRRRRRRNYLMRGVLLATAASVLLISGVQVYFHRLRPSPYDLRVLGQDQWLAGSPASLSIGVLQLPQARLLSEVPVEVTLHNSQTGQSLKLARFSTGAEQACPTFMLPSWEDGDYLLRVAARTDAGIEEITRTIRLKRSWKVMLSTDKPVYQPGQTIHLRALALRKPNLEPVTGEAVEFSVADPKGTVIFRHRDVASKYGIASADCGLATEILEGAYQVECRVGDTVSQRTVEIQKYVLPKFRLDVRLDQPFYQPGQPVEGTLDADYFFGKPVAQAKVEIDVRSEDFAARSIAQLEQTTDQQGSTHFRFDLPDRWFGRPQDQAQARFVLTATVTDPAGQVFSQRVSRIVAAQPIQVAVLPEMGQLVPGVQNTVYLYASYPDGRPAKVRLLIQGYDQEIETSRLGVAVMQVDPSANRLDWTIKAIDSVGRIGHSRVQLSSSSVSGDFVLRTDRAVYDGGQTMTLVALGGGGQPVFVDLIKDGQTMLTRTLRLKDGKHSSHIDLPPDLFGAVDVVAYRYGQHGLAVRKSKTVFIRPASELKVSASLDQPQYRPGAKARLHLQLTDSQGHPTAGAISLAAVDEAVFSVATQRPGMEKVFFLLEEELLQPVYAIYDWSPELGEEAASVSDRTRFEQALFSRTARVDGSMNSVAADVTNRSSHSLNVASFPAKQQRVQRTRSAGRAAVMIAWSSLLGVLAFIGLAAFACRHPRAFVITAGLCAVLLPLGGVILMYLSLGARQPMELFSAAPAAAEAPAEGAEEPAAAAPLRRWFPETLLWRPELITDDHGQVSLDIDLADSITTWRLTASAVSAQGQLGVAQQSIPVFQPFFVDLDLPVTWTRNDEVAVPLIVYNYLDQPQTVQLDVEAAGWFDFVEGEQQPPTSLQLAAGQVGSVHVPIKLKDAGWHKLRVTAKAGGVVDRLERQVEVVADGYPLQHVVSGLLDVPAHVELEIPENVVPGSIQAVVRLYPSTFSQLVEGLDSIFQMPSGCFEQTSSTTYPNVLALDYLKRNQLNVPAVEAKARQYIHVGYQRLLSFEVAGGGFDWYGRAPANETLTAYGLMEFEDMAQVHDVDPGLIQRTRRWLLDRRGADGTWAPKDRMLQDLVGREGDVRLITTAYIAWAVFGSGGAAGEAAPTLDFLLSHPPHEIADPYVLALVICAVAGIDRQHPSLAAYVAELEQRKQTAGQQQGVWWQRPRAARTVFYGAGSSGAIETTALAALALIETGRYPATVQQSLTWLIQQKDGQGNWRSTQATVLALKALIRGSQQPLGRQQSRRIELSLADQVIDEIEISEDQSDVMQQVNLSSLLGPGQHELGIAAPSAAGTTYQVTLTFHLPEPPPRDALDQEPLSITIAYDRQRLLVDERVTAEATIINQLPRVVPMVILDLPIPAGFTIEPQELDELQGSGQIARYQLTPRKAIVYLRGLQPQAKLQLRYRLKASMPVNVAVPPAQVYEYYDPQQRASGVGTRLIVSESGV